MATKHKEFKPFDKVLVKRNVPGCRRISKVIGEWSCAFYSHYSKMHNAHIVSIGGLTGRFFDFEILPYEGNEHLVGTDLPADEKVRLEEGEYLICFDCMDYFENKDFCLSPLNTLRESTVRTKDGNNWTLFIRFSDFNPNDMEETRKHILEVKNGKVVRYKG